MLVTWVHDEMLSPHWVSEDRPAIFVFDEAWIEREQLSLKRIVFLYECLLEMPGVEVRKGDVVAEVTAFAQRHGADTVEVARSVEPRLKRRIEKLSGAGLTVEVRDPEPFVELSGPVDLKRFSRYWRKAEIRVMARR